MKLVKQFLLALTLSLVCILVHLKQRTIPIHLVHLLECYGGFHLMIVAELASTRLLLLNGLQDRSSERNVSGALPPPVEFLIGLLDLCIGSLLQHLNWCAVFWTLIGHK